MPWNHTSNQPSRSRPISQPKRVGVELSRLGEVAHRQREVQDRRSGHRHSVKADARALVCILRGKKLSPPYPVFGAARFVSAPASGGLGYPPCMRREIVCEGCGEVVR